MAKNTKLIVAEGIRLIKAKEDPTASADISALPPEVVTIHGRTTIELPDPHLVRRVTAFRDSAGNIHLELEE